MIGHLRRSKIFYKDLKPTKVHSRRPFRSNMSCNICQAPILVGIHWVNPKNLSKCTQTDHLLPIVSQVCPEEHQVYFRKALVIDHSTEGVAATPSHFGRGWFAWVQYDFGHNTPIARVQEDVEAGWTNVSVSSLP